jgi:radical SAM superfamily enzyme YgiQ (UPF0313 family)
VVAVDQAQVSCYDLCGRPHALVRGDFTYRRALDGRLLQKARSEGQRIQRRLSPDEGAPVVESARQDVMAALAALEAPSGARPSAELEARERLRRIVAADAAALRADAASFSATYQGVGILPPDQYLALVVELTEGCSWNKCLFCELYREVPFHVKPPQELETHLSRVRAYFGDSLPLRRTLFLGGANALCVGHETLRASLAAVTRVFPVAPQELSASRRREWLLARPGSVTGVYAFADAWTGHRKALAELREYAALGLRRVYVGIETGDRELLSWLGKPGSPDDAVGLVRALHEAGISAGVIVLIGAGGERYVATHARHTAEALTRMQLGPGDLLYFSEIVAPPSLRYARHMEAERIRALDPAACAAQRLAVLSSFRPADPARPPRAVTYDIREFVY